MISFDVKIINFINQFSNVSENFDLTVRFISGNSLIKGGVFLSIIWWVWFKKDKDQSLARIKCISTLIGCVIAIAIGRALALLLPFRFRPIHDESLSFEFPYEMSADVLDGWSSFPSDHAVLFFTLSSGLYFISKKIGLLVFLYTTLFIAIPRLYLGLHFPTDLIAGAIIGIVIAYSCNSALFQNRICLPVLNFSTSRPEFFYPLFFLFSYQIAEMFNSSRAALGFLTAAITSLTG